MIDNKDTIAAISTPIGQAGIGIVRMSGDRAFDIAKRIFSPSSQTKISWNSSFKMFYGWVIDPDTGEKVDEVLLSLMKAPRTYTREDIVEINCHGGIVPLRKVLEICIKQGARLAEPGEFTRRAFLNGRIDLSQAESVLDVVQAKTEKSLKLAVKSLGGELSRRVSSIREKIVDLLSLMEAEIDFTEEDIQVLDKEEKEKRISSLIEKVGNLIEKANTGQIYREGVKVVIAGRTNVGKSSLLNTLLARERAIVSHIPGTTRDTIEEIVNIKGFPVCMIDTAGIGNFNTLLEKESVKRTCDSLKIADIVLLMVDGSSPLTEEDENAISLVKKLKKQTLLLINKIDLPQKIDKGKLKNLFPDTSPVEISALKGTGLEKLKERIAKLILEKVAPDSEEIMVNLRQKDCLEKAKSCLLRAKEGLKKDVSVEFLAFELREAISHLDEITGRRLGEEILDRIFSQFCIGK